MAPQAPPDESLRPALEALAGRDADIARAYALCGLPPERSRAPGFAGLLTIMAAQQVSAQAARAIVGRLLAAADPLTPEAFLALDDAALKTVGFSRQKTRYGRALAEDLAAGRLDLDAVARLDDEAAIEELIGVKGVGRWTAEIYLLFALRRPDVWPVDDLAVCAGVQRLKRLAERPSRARMLEIGAPWRPHRSAAARFLWHFYHHPGVPD
jgi:DNA-3-methyladenine glycosylase II